MKRCIVYPALLCLLLVSCFADKQLVVREPESFKPLSERIYPGDPAIRYVGRIDFSDSERPSFVFPGTSISARFTGSGIDVILSGSGDRDFFNVIIDNKILTVIQTVPGMKVYTIARNLANRAHTVEVFKRTECSTVSFLGFNLGKGRALVPFEETKRRKIEFYGDSMTAGYGNEIAVLDPSDLHFTPKNENNYNAYGAITARHFDADYVAVCMSGRGIFRNFGGDETDTIPKISARVFPDRPDGPVWDFSRYVPDVVVINLGSNDYISELSRQDLSREEFDAAFSAAYSLFVEDLRSRYGGGVKIICIAGGFLNDWYPQGTDSLTRSVDSISCVVDRAKAKGDANISLLILDTILPPFGEDFHPSHAAHKKFAEALIPRICEMTGWK